MIDLLDYGVLPGQRFTLDAWLQGGTIDLGYRNFDEIKADHPEAKSLNDDAFFFGFRRAMKENHGPIEVLFQDAQYQTEQIFNNGYRGLYVNRDDVKIIGNGASLISHGNVSAGFTCSPYRRAGWKENEIVKFHSTPKKGERKIIIDNVHNTDLNDGDKIFIRSGGRKFDIDQGEFNIIEKIIGNIVFLKYELRQDYSLTFSRNSGMLKDFKNPRYNEELEFVYQGDSFKAIKNGMLVSVNENNFKVVGKRKQGTIMKVTLKNEDPSIGEGVFTIDSFVYKSRGVIRCDETSSNISIHNMSFESAGDVINTSNTIGLNVVGCKFHRTATQGKGTWLDGDGGRDIKLHGCKATSETPIGSQLARSTCDFEFVNCELKDTSINISEFSRNILVKKNKIHQRTGINNGKPFEIEPIGLGWTTGDLTVIDNDVVGDGTFYGIGSGQDIDFEPNTYRGQNEISRNHIHLTKGNQVISIAGHAINNVQDNKCSGDSVYLFAITAHQHNEFGPCQTRFINNDFDGYCNAYMSNYMQNVIFKGGVINRRGPSTKGNPATQNGGGNIVWGRKGIQPEPYGYCSLKDVVFKGWNLRPDSINWNGGEDVEFENIIFIDEDGRIFAVLPEY